MRAIEYSHRDQNYKIPQDWDIELLSDLCDQIGDGIHSTPEYVESSDCYFINGNNLEKGKIIFTDNTKNVSYSEYCKYKLNLSNTTVLLSINGTIGNLSFYNNEQVVLGKSVAFINLKKKCTKEYLFYFLQSKTFSDYIENELTSTTIRNLSLQSIRNTPIVVPSFPEQQAIAEVLSDMDAYIDSLEQLIAKKRLIKQGVMQELLTGKRRLPGFTGKWEEQYLGSLGECLRGVSYKPDTDLFAGDMLYTIRLLRSNNIQEFQIKKGDLQFVKSSIVSPSQKLLDNDIVVCMANGNPNLVGKAARFLNNDNYDYTFGAFMSAFRPSNNLIQPEFALYLFSTESYRSQINILIAGSSINNLTTGKLKSVKVKIPKDKSEQRAICRFLGDLDEEINILEEKYQKINLIKQGMMQELLTGRIRFV